MCSAAFEVFDRRLSRAGKAPLGVAFSGGGDSLMALKQAVAWARPLGRGVIAFHVDHRLQSHSAAWSQRARAEAERLGARFIGLAWEGPKPATGLPAAARDARHRLIAQAARRAGVRALVIGHTADDMIEAELMRDAGHRMGALREWSPSPVWPEGRGLFCVRPLLGLRRAAIRQALAAEGETWIDDPLNQDLRSPRARARIDAARLEAPAAPRADEDLARLAVGAVVGAGGDISLDRRTLRAASPIAVRRLVGAAAACAGGRDGPARGDRIEALAEQLLGEAAFAGTLSGARVQADANQVHFARDAGEAARGGLQPLALAAGETGVWDGRFEAVAGPSALTITRLAGRAAALRSRQREALRRLPALVRPGLPVMVTQDGAPDCPILAESLAVDLTLLVAERFFAACGVILKEPAT